MSEDKRDHSTSKPLPSASDLLHLLRRVEEYRSQEHDPYEERWENSIRAEEAYQHLIGLQEHYRQKTNWSYFLLSIIAFMILFQSGVIVAVGLELLSLDKYEWLLPALLVQNLAQVIGLAVFVVRSLYKDIR